MPIGLRISRSLTLISALLCSPFAMSGGITDINIDFNGDYYSAYGGNWNTEVVIELGTASSASNGFLDITGEMRMYMAHDFITDLFPSRGPATNPIIALDLTDVMYANGLSGSSPFLAGAGIYNDRSIITFQLRDTSSSPVSELTSNFMSQALRDECSLDPFRPYCINFDEGNSRARLDFFLPTIESSGNIALDLGEIHIFDQGNDVYSIDPDYSIYNNDFSPNMDLEIALSMSFSEVAFGAHDFYLTTEDMVVVPVPAAAWLMVSGLFVLAGVARRRA